MSASSLSVSARIFWLIFLVLLFLHQDFWNWTDERTVFLGMPVGLFHHALFSVACSVFGAWAVCRAWPKEWEEWADPLDASSEESTESKSSFPKE